MPDPIVRLHFATRLLTEIKPGQHFEYSAYKKLSAQSLERILTALSDCTTAEKQEYIHRFKALIPLSAQEELDVNTVASRFGLVDATATVVARPVHLGASVTPRPPFGIPVTSSSAPSAPVIPNPVVEAAVTPAKPAVVTPVIPQPAIAAAVTLKQAIAVPVTPSLVGAARVIPQPAQQLAVAAAAEFEHDPECQARINRTGAVDGTYINPQLLNLLQYFKTFANPSEAIYISTAKTDDNRYVLFKFSTLKAGPDDGQKIAAKNWFMRVVAMVGCELSDTFLCDSVEKAFDVRQGYKFFLTIDQLNNLMASIFPRSILVGITDLNLRSLSAQISEKVSSDAVIANYQDQNERQNAFLMQIKQCVGGSLTGTQVCFLADNAEVKSPRQYYGIWIKLPAQRLVKSLELEARSFGAVLKAENSSPDHSFFALTPQKPSWLFIPQIIWPYDSSLEASVTFDRKETPVFKDIESVMLTSQPLPFSQGPK